MDKETKKQPGFFIRSETQRNLIAPVARKPRPVTPVKPTGETKAAANSTLAVIPEEVNDEVRPK